MHGTVEGVSSEGRRHGAHVLHAQEVDGRPTRADIRRCVERRGVHAAAPSVRRAEGNSGNVLSLHRPAPDVDGYGGFSST